MNAVRISLDSSQFRRPSADGQLALL